MYREYLPEFDKYARVISFTDIYLPTKEKHVQSHAEYNEKLTLVREEEDRQMRNRKRVTKEHYKTVCEILKQKAGYLPISQFLEDFYYLQGCNKSGAPLKRTSSMAH